MPPIEVIQAAERLKKDEYSQSEADFALYMNDRFITSEWAIKEIEKIFATELTSTK